MSDGEEIVFQNGLSETQEKILAFIPILPSLASAFGSAMIVYIVCSARRRNPYKRILFAMSVCDIISSLAFPFQSFLVPQESSQIALAIGTDATCSMMGFFTQFGFSGLLYNGMLSFYFLCTVRFAMKDNVFARRFEALVHLIAFGYPLMTAISGVVINAFHEQDLGFGCWVSDYPEGCIDCINTDIELADEEDGVCCKTIFLGWLFGGFPALIVFLGIIINNLVIYIFVRRTIKRAERFNPESRLSITATSAPDMAKAATATTREFPSSHQDSGSTIAATTIGDASEWAVPVSNTTRQENRSNPVMIDGSSTNVGVQDSSTLPRPRRSASRKKADNRNSKITMVAVQALLYVGAYLVTFAAGLTLRIMGSMEDYSTADQSPLFPIMVLHHLLFPFQGALNIFVYIRPNFIRVRKEFPDCSRWWALRRSLFGTSVPVRKSGASYHFGNMAKRRFSLSGSLFGNTSTVFLNNTSRGPGNDNSMVKNDSKNENCSTSFHVPARLQSRTSANVDCEAMADESKIGEDSILAFSQCQHDRTSKLCNEGMVDDESKMEEGSLTSFVHHQDHPAHSSLNCSSEGSQNEDLAFEDEQ